MAEDRPLPEIPECRVEKLPDGRLKVTHHSGTAALADDERRARLAGLRLRVVADLFPTGDPA
jgi:hypothetical protein